MFSLPKPPKITKKEGNRALIEILDLYPGYGATLGNTLRRVLYSSLPGAAITSIKIEGVSHEFSTLEGVLEDIIEISLNLKQIKLILYGDEPQVLTLKIKGQKEIKAKDIETPSQVEIINKDAHIATLTSQKSSLIMDLKVENGLGYVQAEHNEKEKKEIGTIRLDAVFTPIVKASFEVENMRVGDRTDYNKLIVDITTDGSLSPEQAFISSVEILSEHLDILRKLEVSKKKPAKTAKKLKSSKNKNTKSNKPKKITTKAKSVKGKKT